MHKGTPMRSLRLCVPVLLAFLIAGCVSVEAPGVPIKIAAVEGMPAERHDAVIAVVRGEALVHAIELTETDPRFFLRGYLGLQERDGEMRLGFVWDVFDANRTRARRITADVATSSASWDEVGEAEIRNAAAKAMNEVAAFLAERR
jgi:hypothetical protein